MVSITNNEFLAPRYDVPAGPGSSQTLGEAFTSLFNFPLSNAAKWGGIIYLVCVAAGFILVLAPLALQVSSIACLIVCVVTA
jgi:hypothetical protein